DVIPQIPGDQLMVEIMTPHYAHYYAPSNKPEDPVISPHDSGQPNPISFLTVPPGAKFVFFVTCDTKRLKSVAPDLAENDRWKQLLEAAFEHAFGWLGFGAKTAVGYGAMRKIEQAVASGTGEQPQAGQQRRPEGWPQATVWEGATLKYDPGQRSITAVLRNQKSAPLRGQEAEKLLEQLGAERAEQLKKQKSLANVDLEVEVLGNRFKIKKLAAP
ncbi:MAG: type III-B CRISPR module RAMP protein Cmr6, partial [Bryobacteraceae bacterium]